MNWKLVRAGSTVPKQVEGGFMGEAAPEDGVVFKTRNDDAFYLSKSQLRDLLKSLNESYGRKKRP